ncbi:MAG: DUF1499 domain-containing protein [Devosiaceae bacterium]|nr:DUF1499 domain-containing protein [Devosiaceae bacterium]
MRIVLKTSKLASWSRRLGSIAFPVLAFSVFMHRSGSIDSETFHLIVFLGLATASLAIIFALISFIILWFSGDKGWGRGITGLILGGLCVAPLLFSLVQFQKYPIARDVSTDPETQIELLSPLASITNVEQANQQELIRAFPNMVVRYYPLSAEISYDLVKGQIIQNGWEIIGERPITENNAGQINAIITTLFGWRDEVAVQIEENAQGSTIKMRSASLIADSDLGSNGKRIERFLLDMDNAITKYIRDNLELEQPSSAISDPH